jgi:transposase-like protein
MGQEDFPRTTLEFAERFATEEACREYLVSIRWPEGFCCPSCKGGKYWVNSRHVLVCARCDRQISLTAGTVMERSHKSLRMWFHAMWWIATQKTGGSARGLQRLLGLPSYQTAWAWLAKLRRAMVRTDRELLEGPVEVDEAYIGGEEEGVHGRQTRKKARVVIAVEARGDERPVTGRVRFKVVKDFSARSLTPFVVQTVAPDARVITDGWEGYRLLKKHGFVHEVRKLGGDRKAAGKLLPHVHRAIALLKRWLVGTHQGAVSRKHLQHYLEEFAFRHNRRKSKHVGKIFYRLVQGASATQVTPYWRLVGRRMPGTPLHMGGT